MKKFFASERFGERRVVKKLRDLPDILSGAGRNVEIEGEVEKRNGLIRGIAEMVLSLLKGKEAPDHLRREAIRRIAVTVVAAAGIAMTPDAAFAQESDEGEDELSFTERLISKLTANLNVGSLNLINSFSATLSFGNAIKGYLAHSHFSPEDWMAALAYLGVNTATNSHGPQAAIRHLGVDLAYLGPVMYGTTLGDVSESVQEELDKVPPFEVDDNLGMGENLKVLFSKGFDRAHIASLSSGAYAIWTDQAMRSLAYKKFFSPALIEFKTALSGLKDAASDDKKQRIDELLIEGEMKTLEELCRDAVDEKKVDEQLIKLVNTLKDVARDFSDSENEDDKSAIKNTLEAAKTLVGSIGFELKFDTENLQLTKSKKRGKEHTKWQALKMTFQSLRSLSNLLGMNMIGDPPNFLLLMDPNLSIGEKLGLQFTSVLEVLPLLTRDAQKSIVKAQEAFDEKTNDNGFFESALNEVRMNIENAHRIYINGLAGGLTGLSTEATNTDGSSRSMLERIAEGMKTKGVALTRTTEAFVEGLMGGLVAARHQKPASDDLTALKNNNLVDSEIPNVEGRRGDRYLWKLLAKLNEGSINNVMTGLNLTEETKNEIKEALEAGTKRFGLNDQEVDHGHDIDWGDLRLGEILKEAGLDPNKFRLLLAKEATLSADGNRAKRALLGKLYGSNGELGAVEFGLDYFSEYLKNVKEVIGVGTEEVLALVMLQVVYLQSVMPTVYFAIDQIVGDAAKKDEHGEYSPNQESLPKETFDNVVSSLVLICGASAVADNLAMFMACQKTLVRMKDAGLFSEDQYKLAIELTYEAAIGFGALTKAGGPASAPQRDSSSNAASKGWPTVMANAVSKLPWLYSLLSVKGVNVQEQWFTRLPATAAMGRLLQTCFGGIADFMDSTATGEEVECIHDDGNGEHHEAKSGLLKKIALYGNTVAQLSLGDKPEKVAATRKNTIRTGANALIDALT